MKSRSWMLVIVLAGLLAYAGSFQGAFVFDESQSVLRSPRIRFEETGLEDWIGPRAVGDLSFVLNYRVHGERPAGYHAVNLLIHLLSALLAYGLIRRISERVSPRADREGLAFWVALVWVVHPLTTSAVTYVYQRYELLMTLFYLLTLYALIRGSEAVSGRRWYGLAVAACFLGMASKEIMITAPVIALAFDRIFLAQDFREILKKRGWVHLGLMSSWGCLGSLMALRMTQAGAFDQIYGKVSSSYAITQCHVIGHYLRLSIWPSPLCLDYAWPLSSGMQQGWPFVLVIGALGVATVLGLWRAPRLAFSGLFFFVVLSPTSSIIARPDAAFEHRMYLPLLAVLTIAVLGVQRACPQWRRSSPDGPGGRIPVHGVLLALLVLVYGGMTWSRNRDYRSRRVMWQDVVEKAPGNLRAYVNLAVACLDEGDMAAAGRSAARLLEQAPARFPDVGGDTLPARGLYRSFDALYCAQAENILGIAALDRGELDQAEQHLRSATKLWRDFLDPYVNLGLVFARRGDTEKAIAWWEDALSLVPGHPGALANLADVYEQQGSTGKALVALKRLAAARPERSDIRERIRRLTVLSEMESNQSGE